MNTRVLTVLGVLTILPLASGCGSMKHLLFGRGAACGNCPAPGPGFNVPPVLPGHGIGGPGFGGPGFGGPGGCGGPGCSAPHGGDYGCGSEFGGGYDSRFGGYDAGYSMDSMNIGMPIVGSSFNPNGALNSYDAVNPGWINSNEQIVPGSRSYSDGAPIAPMQTLPPMQGQ